MSETYMPTYSELSMVYSIEDEYRACKPGNTRIFEAAETATIIAMVSSFGGSGSVFKKSSTSLVMGLSFGGDGDVDSQLWSVRV